MKKPVQEFRMGTGASSILLVLVVLCLTVLGILAYSAARADNALTMRSVAATEAYYAAVCQAEEELFKIAASREPGAFAFQITAGEGLALDVRGQCVLGELTVSRYALVNTDAWQTDDGFDLYSRIQEP